MSKSVKRIRNCGYACLICAALSLALAFPTLEVPANRYSFSCIFCAALFGGLTVASAHTGRDLRLWQGVALLIGGAIWVIFSIRPSFIWLSAFFGLMMTLSGAALSFIHGAFAGYLGLAYSTICALMLLMSGIGLYLSRESSFSELTYLLQSFLAFGSFFLCGIAAFLENRRRRA